MARTRLFLSIALAFAMLLPAAAATTPAELRAPAGALTTGPATALFAVLHDEGFSFRVDAAAIILETRAINFTYVAPVTGSRPITTIEDNAPERTTASLGSGTLSFVSAEPNAGFLLQDAGGAAAAKSRHAAPLAIRAVESPHVASEPTFTNNNRVPWNVEGDIAGSQVAMVGTNADYEFHGTFSLELFGVTYELNAQDKDALQRTGAYETGPTRGRFQLDRLILQDATVRVHSPGDATLFSAAPLLSLPAGGALDILDAAGNAVGQAPVGSDGARLDLVLAPQSATIAPARTAATTSAGWILVPLVLVLGALVALVAWRRRQRDDLALALHAMEERRFRDALKPLRRLRAKNPHDPAILLDEAICLEETGALVQARAAYEAALAVWPTHAEAHYFLARTLARLRLQTDASRHLARALELDERLDELARRDAMLSLLPGDAGISA